jgi:hypothetical protein
MKISLGPQNLQTEFEFNIFKKIAGIRLVHNQISNANKIGVFLSGGPDSAALLCLILAELTNTNNDVPVHCFIVDKNEGQVHYGIDTIKEAEKLFNKQITYSIEEHHPDSEYPSRLGSKTYKHITENNLRTIFYQGINNPPDESIKTFSSDVPRSYGNKTVLSYGSSLMCFPFLFLHKPQIMDVFYKLGCESVIQYTQSCYIQSSGSCGKCYSCEERAWGFEALGKLDPQITAINSHV